MYQKSATFTNSSNWFASPTQSSRSKHLQSGSGLAFSSSLFASEDPLKTPKRKHTDEPTKSKKKLAQGTDQSRVVPSSGSLEHSKERQLRREVVYEEE